MTLEERLKQIIGQLVFENAALAAELEKSRNVRPVAAQPSGSDESK